MLSSILYINIFLIIIFQYFSRYVGYRVICVGCLSCDHVHYGLFFICDYFINLLQIFLL